VWSISEYDANEQLRYVVTLAAEGASATRVTVDVTGPNKAAIARNRVIRNMYIIAMKEQIAAALEQRDFQTYKIVLPSVIAVLVNLFNISAWLSGGPGS
jgi:ribosomal protein S9